MDTARPRVPRPRGGGYVFACAPCALIYRDGADYQACLRCDRAVDWVDARAPVWICRKCDVVTNREVMDPSCASCRGPIHLLAAPERERAPGRPLSAYRMAGYAFVVFLVAQTLFALADPGAFPYLAPILVIAQLIGLTIIGGVALVSREIRSLVDHRTRIIHGLEHATVAVLEERKIEVRSGVTHTGSFLLVLDHDGRIWERSYEIGAAARDAIRRVRTGEHALAYHPRCGTSYLVAMCLYGVAIVVAGLGANALGAPVGITWAITVAAGLTARAIARPAGLAVQRWLTVSTDFAHARVTAVDRHAMSDGDRVVFTVSIDVELRPREGGLVSPTPLG